MKLKHIITVILLILLGFWLKKKTEYIFTNSLELFSQSLNKIWTSKVDPRIAKIKPSRNQSTITLLHPHEINN